jgi:hypothetical protein
MAQATRSTLENLLKDFYVGPIQETLNTEVLAVDMFEKLRLDWNGKQVIIPVHSARSAAVVDIAGGGDTQDVKYTDIDDGGSSVAFGTETGALPVANSQTYLQLTVTAKQLFGRFQITGLAMASAKSGGVGSFASYVDAEMNRLADDLKNLANRAFFSGGHVLGLIHEKKSVAAEKEFEFCGDIAKCNSVRTERVAEVAVTLRRTDTMAEIPGSPEALETVNLDRSTIEFKTAVNSESVPGGVAMWVEVTDANANVDYLDNEVGGVLNNLGKNDHFGNTRSAAASAGLRTVVRTASKEAPVVGQTKGQKATLALEQLQDVLDQIDVRSGAVPDVLLCHPVMRQEYIKLCQGTVNINLAGGGALAKGDAGVLNISYNNIPFRAARQCPRGLVFFLQTKGWKLAQLEAPGFADLDGAILSRVNNVDAFDGYYRWYFDLVCTSPSTQGVLTGIDFSGAGAGE